MLGKLNDAQINNILSSQVTGRLACTDGMQPYIVPVTFTYDGKYIYGQTNEGAKLEILRKNPNVCFEVDMMTNMRNWQCAIVYGRFEELENKDAEQARDILLNRVYPLMTSTTVITDGTEPNDETGKGTRIKNVMYRIKLKEVTGRFEKE